MATTMGERGGDRLLLRVALGPASYTQSQAPLVDIVVIAVCGVLCGCDGPTAIHRRASERREWLGQSLELPDGIPSRDRIRRLIMALKPAAFQKCFQEWTTHAIEPDESRPGRPIAIDGKTNRWPHDRAADLGPLHIVTAWASEEGSPGPGRHRGETQRDHRDPRSGARPLGHRADAPGAGRELPRRRQSHP